MIDFTDTWWPPSEDDLRIANYKRRQQLFESDHAKAFERRSAKIPVHLRSKLYLIQDYPKLISSTFAGLLFGQVPVFSMENGQDVLNSLIESNRLGTALYEAELSASFRGDAVFKVSLESRHPGAAPEILIEEIPAYCYFAELDPDNQRRLLSQCLAWERTVCRKGQPDQRYLRVEHHGAGWVRNELFEIEGFTKVKKQVRLSVLYGDSAPPEEYLTGVPMPLLFHLPNERHGSCYYGMSDYTTGLETLFDEANARITGIAEVLDKHKDPRLILPTGVLDKRGQIRTENLEIIEVAPEDAVSNAPRLLTWDAQLSSSFQQLEEVKKRILEFAYVSKALLKEDAGNIDSGRAMTQCFTQMLARVALKQSYREPVIKEILFCAMALSAVHLGTVAPDGLPELLWRNGLPKDDQELTNVAVAQVASRIMSRHTAIRYVRQVGDREADEEMARIDMESAADTPPPGALADPLPEDPANPEPDNYTEEVPGAD